MKTIHKLSDLEAYGIRPLTGEACRVVGSGRVLCDLTSDGAATVADLLGLPHHRSQEQTFCSNWNPGAVGSFMLNPGMFPELAAWCLLRSGCKFVVLTREGVYGREDQDADEEWNEAMGSVRQFSKYIRSLSSNDRFPGSGTRAIHAISGRTE